MMKFIRDVAVALVASALISAGASSLSIDAELHVSVNQEISTKQKQ